MSDTGVKNKKEKPQNPPAFPFSTIDGFTHNGMDLRDYFAGLAMQGILSSQTEMRANGMGNDSFGGQIENLVRESYSVADEMLKQKLTN